MKIVDRRKKKTEVALSTLAHGQGFVAGDRLAVKLEPPVLLTVPGQKEAACNVLVVERMQLAQMDPKAQVLPVEIELGITD